MFLFSLIASVLMAMFVVLIFAPTGNPHTKAVVRNSIALGRYAIPYCLSMCAKLATAYYQRNPQPISQITRHNTQDTKMLLADPRILLDHYPGTINNTSNSSNENNSKCGCNSKSNNNNASKQ